MNRITKNIHIVIDALMDERQHYDQVAADIRTAKIELERTPLADTQTRDELAELIGELETELEEAGTQVKTGIARLTLTSLTRYEYLSILKDNLPREDNELDQRFGYNTDTFGGALLRKATIAAEDANGEKITPDFDRWLDDETGVSFADFEAWFMAAMSLQNSTTASNFPL